MAELVNPYKVGADAKIDHVNYIIPRLEILVKKL